MSSSESPEQQQSAPTTGEGGVGGGVGSLRAECSTPPGFEGGPQSSAFSLYSGVDLDLFGPPTNSDYLFPSFMDSPTNANTSFISENSFNSILRPQEPDPHNSTSGFFSSPTSKGSIFAGMNLDNDLSFLDTGAESLDEGSRSNSLNSFGGFWGDNNSPTSTTQMPAKPSHLSPNISRLTINECVQLIQILSSSLNDYQSSEDKSSVSSTLTLMQLVQAQLKLEIEARLYNQQSSPRRTPLNSSSSLDSPVDRTAKFHRDIAVTADASFTWSGQLPPRVHRNPTYSCKIFLGGVPFDITESALVHAFKPFGNVKIEWPGKETIPSQPKGYLYVIFEHEKQVKLLLQSCFLDYSKSHSGDWYFKLTSKRFREKDVQVIPWAISDSNHVKCPTAKIDAKKTIFVGALHGMLNAEGLSTIMNDLFGGVVYAGIDTDRHKYPIGSGRVTFNNMKSYMKAVSAAFVEIKTKFKKKVQVDPYLEDATCSACSLQQGPYFCREWCCFRYFCRTCYQSQHNSEEYRKHRPLMRNASKPQGTQGAVTTVSFSPLGNRNGGGRHRQIENGHGNGGYSHNSSNNSSSSTSSWNGSSYGGYQQHQQQRKHEYGSRFANPMVR